MAKYTKYNGRRKPELLDSANFSLTDYQEADRVLGDWKTIADKAEKLYGTIPASQKDAFLELILFPIKACYQVNEIYIAAAKNQLYASQGRASANGMAARVRALFQADAEWTKAYNQTLAGGKWNHMMDQTHIGYTNWQQPPQNNMPRLTEIEVPEAARMGVAIEGSASAWPGAADAPALPKFDSFNRPRRYIEVFNKGKTPFEFSAAASVPWIVLSKAKGTVESDERLWVSVDWTKAPAGSASGSVRISGPGADPVAVKVELFNPREIARTTLNGFVEADGYVSIEAEHYAILSPSLNFAPGRGVRLAVSLDDQAPQVVQAIPRNYVAGDRNRDWEESVKNSSRTVKTTHKVDKPGYHTLKIWMVDPAVVLQKIVVDLGGMRPSYLGPPESHRNVAPETTPK